MAMQKNNNYTVSGLYDLIFVKNIKQILVGSTIIVACATLFFTHQLYVIWREKSAQRDFGPLMTRYSKMMHEKDAQWSELLEQFEDNYKKHSGSNLMPYYMLYKSHILLEQNKKEEALAYINTINSDMPYATMSPLLQMERALIALDSTDDAVQKEGEESLKKLAFDKNNQFNDSALFYLGRYYWTYNDRVQARDAWQQLVDEQRNEKMSPSPWVQQVKEYLTLMVV